MSNAIYETNFPKLRILNRGKVRDIYDLGDKLLIVATDRISAFDVILPQPIPYKGRVLTSMSLYWFNILRNICQNHLISANVKDYPSTCREYSNILDGRSMLVKKSKPIPIECVVRGYLSGSGWNDYKKNGAVSGIKLPDGLKESQKLDSPIFTPTTKELPGKHDETIDFKKTKEMIGNETAQRIKSLSISLYQKASEIALAKGMIIADTKFEFGIYDNEIILIDEVLTPDSSRFWPKDQFVEGGPQMSFDKQFVRDYLIKIKWDQKPPAPDLPADIIENTSKKYLEAIERLDPAGHTQVLGKK